MATIKVIRGYRGVRTQEQFIPPGVYDADDPKLFGNAQHLVDLGRAHWVGQPPAAVPSDNPESTDGSPPDDDPPLTRDDFTLLSGIAEITAQKLYELGILTFVDLADQEPAALLAGNLGVGPAKAQQYIDAALAHLEAASNDD